MRRQRLFWIVVSGLWAAGCGPATPATAPTNARSAVAMAKQGTIEVVIADFGFKPAELTVPAGTRVTWVNRDDDPHTVTSSDRPQHFDSGALDTGERFDHVFAAPGSYAYFCTAHPKMTARIIVK